MKKFFSTHSSRLLIMLLAMPFISISQNTKTNHIENTDTVNAYNSRTMHADINGRKIAYRSIGKGEPIILCQRFRGNLDSWDPAFLNALANNHTVITFDYSGFGLSTGEAATDMLSFAKDVKDLAQYLGYKKIIVGGWSFGGAVAQITASEITGFVSQVVLIGTRPPGTFNHFPEQIFLEVSRKPVNDLDDEIILFFEPASAASRAKAKESHDRIAKRTSDTDVYIKPELWPNYVKGFEDFQKDPYNAREKISNGNIPVLVISADHEVVFPPENWFELNRKMKAIQLVVIPQSGHGPHHQYPEMVAEYIISFVKNNKAKT